MNLFLLITVFPFDYLNKKESNFYNNKKDFTIFIILLYDFGCYWSEMFLANSRYYAVHEKYAKYREKYSPKSTFSLQVFNDDYITYDNGVVCCRGTLDENGKWICGPDYIEHAATHLRLCCYNNEGNVFNISIALEKKPIQTALWRAAKVNNDPHKLFIYNRYHSSFLVLQNGDLEIMNTQHLAKFQKWAEIKLQKY